MEKEFKNFITTVINTVDMDKEARKALLLNSSSCKSLTDCLRRTQRSIWQILLIVLPIILEITIRIQYRRYSEQSSY